MLGYRIDYGQPCPAKVRKKNPVSLILCTFLAVFMLIAGMLWPAMGTQIREFLIPGDADVTVAAFSELILDMREGESLGEALRLFGWEILHGDGEAD